MPPTFVKPSRVIGNKIVLRLVSTEDAAFILSLRMDPAKGRYLSPTSPDLATQVEWIQRCAADANQVYFIIEDRYGERYGTTRLYEPIDDAYCWGSWILRSDRPSGFAMESALMTYQFALYCGFTKAYFDVRIGNENVWKFHERFGAVRVSLTDQDYFYNVSLEAILKTIERNRSILPDGITVVM